MVNRIQQFYRCPFCSGRKGEVSISINSLLRQPLAHARFSNRTSKQKIILFAPVAAAPRPCPHMVSLYVEGVRLRIEADVTTEYPVFALSWFHPWFAQHDQREEMVAFMSEFMVGEDEDSEFQPSIPRELGRVRRFWKVPGPFELKVRGWFLTAQDPLEFMNALPDCQRRLEESRAQEDEFVAY